MKKLLYILRVFSIAIILILAALVFVPNLLGITPTIDLLGTMKPKISKGSISYVNRNFKYKNINKNDIIEIKVYNQNLMVRVQSKNDKDKTLNVKGDSESKQQAIVISKKEYIGKYAFSVPYVGFIVLFFQRNFFITIILFVIVIISLIMDFIEYKNNEEENPKKEKYENKKIDNKKNNANKKEEEKTLEILELYDEKKDIKESSKNTTELKKDKDIEIEILDDDEVEEINKILEQKKK